MTTRVTLTGTGVPHPAPGRAGAGTLVRSGDLALQFDAGRSTVMRLVEAGVAPHALDALFLTHIHSDHLADVADLAMTRWIQDMLHPSGPLTIVCPEGQCTRFVDEMFDPFAVDIALRAGHAHHGPLEVDRRAFAATREPTEVWRSPDGSVHVEAVLVHHEPVEEAVAYRVTTPDGVVVISGDTRVCAEVEHLAQGCDVLVHEACRATAMREVIRGTAFEQIFDYHADAVALGGLAERAGVGHLLLTHLIPQPTTAAEAEAFAADVRAGGYTGPVTVGEDLTTVAVVAPG
ncbi:MAG: MBL fold metallo-hydrolase [Actinomycetes bacterium]